jgi:mono/diheme cytochrome c family protein
VSRRRLLLAALAVVLLLAVTIPLGYRRLLWSWELNPVLRGRLLAETEGCVDCHGPSFAAAIPNPGSRWGTVPRFGGGNAFMYVHAPEQIAEMIRQGAPSAWLEKPEIRERLENQRLRMPAFSHLSDREVADLVAYVQAAEGFQLPDDAAVAAGRELAREHGCTSCHGVEGAGGRPNPGSLGGFIPGFAGGNFPDLVQDEEEFREWVRTGTSRRLEANPAVRWFWRRQRLSMPAYGDAVTGEQLGQLWAWVGSLRGTTGPDTSPSSP